MLDDEEIRKRALGNMMEGEQLNWLLGVNSIIIRIFFGIICIKCRHLFTSDFVLYQCVLLSPSKDISDSCPTNETTDPSVLSEPATPLGAHGGLPVYWKSHN